VNCPVKPGHNLQTHADCLDKKRTGLRGADILTALDLEDAGVFAASFQPAARRRLDPANHTGRRNHRGRTLNIHGFVATSQHGCTLI
jgi:hypothetical protein